MDETPQQILQNFLTKFSVSKVLFAELSGVSRRSIFKYLNGEPIHHLKAKAMSNAMRDNFQYYVPPEKLMYKK